MTALALGRGAKSASGLSLVIPIYNEAACIDELVKRCLAVCRHTGREFELVLVDDGSDDASPELIRTHAHNHPTLVAGVLLNRNYGQHAAVMAGLEASRHDIVVTLDADLQNPPEEIPKLLIAIDRGHDVVGSRRLSRQDGLVRRVGSWVINRFVQSTTGVRMTDYGCMLRAYRRDVVNAVLRCTERSIFVPVLANSFASNPTEVDVRHEARNDGTSRYSLWRLVNLQFDLLTSVTTLPMRLLNLLGVSLALIGFGCAAVLLFTRLIYGAEWAAGGVFTVLAALFFLVGVQLFGLGLLGEYIGRIYTDVRGRPRFHIHARVGICALDGRGGALTSGESEAAPITPSSQQVESFAHGQRVPDPGLQPWRDYP